MTVAELERAIEGEKTLASQLAQYAGKWVATHGQAVIASATTLRDLLEQVKEEKVESVFRVPGSGSSACFF